MSDEIIKDLIERRKNEDCGCPEELWLMGNIEVTIHFESDGSGHIIADAGDWDHEFFVEDTSMNDLRQQAADYINSLPVE